MISLVLYELKLKRRIMLGWLVVIALYIGLVAWAERALEEGEMQRLYEELVKQYPEEFIKLFAKGIPLVFTSEVFYTIEYFVFMYVIVLAAYIAYVSAGSIVDDVLDKTGFIVLTTPQTRTRILLSKFLSNTILAVVITLLSLILTVTLVNVVAGRQFNVERIALLHVTGLVYLTTYIALGSLLGSILPLTIAKPVSATIALVAYLLDTMTLGTSLEILGYLSPSRYFPVLDMVVEGEVRVAYIILLVATTIAALALALVAYNRRDLYL